jgi:hypothetical protein
MEGEPLIFAASHLGLALFSFSLLALFSLSISQFAPNVPNRKMRTGETKAIRSNIRSKRLWIQAALTSVLGAAALWIIVVARHSHDDVNWAYGTLLMLLGYWLKI